MNERYEKATGEFRETETGNRVGRERDWLISTARERGGDIFAGKLTNLAAVAEEVAAALHASARKLSDHDSPVISRYCDLTAGELTTVAAALRNWDMETMISTTRRFAGSHPVFFLGGAMAAGFVVTRILKSSPGIRGSAAERGK
jgi:hypothetical protein